METNSRAFFLIFAAIWGLSEAIMTCYKPLDNCDESTCFKITECIHGVCNEKGECKCNYCYSGTNCTMFKDKYGPKFIESEATVQVHDDVTGTLFTAKAVDHDSFGTCAMEANCPCAVIHYFINVEMKGIFEIDEFTGAVSVKPGVQLSENTVYDLEIIATSNPAYSNNQFNYLQSMTLFVEVGKTEEDYEIYEDESNVRVKRESSGTSPKSVRLDLLTLTDVDRNASLYPGSKVDFAFNIVLPKLEHALSFAMEIFAEDIIYSQKMGFALYNFTISSIGTEVVYNDSSPVSIDNITVSYIKTGLNSNMNQHILLDFGNITSSGEPGTDHTDSTISGYFSAAFIKNTSYTSSTVNMTCGVIYNNTYIVLTQDSFNCSMTPPTTYPSDMSVTVPSTIKQWSGEVILVSVTITNPIMDLMVEAFIDFPVYDEFSFTDVSVIKYGDYYPSGLRENIKPTVTYRKSVTKRTNLFANFSLSFIQAGGNRVYPLINDTGHVVEIGLNLFIWQPKVDSIIKFVFVASLYGNEFFVAEGNTKVVAADVQPAITDPSAVTVSPVGDTTVVENGVLSFAITFTLNSNASSQIDCSFTGLPAGQTVCGVLYGKAGHNIFYFPELKDYVVFDGSGGVSWIIDVNTTSLSPEDDYSSKLDIEIAIRYEIPTPSDVTGTCNGNSLTLSASPGTENITDFSGVFELVGTSVNWYHKTQKAAELILTFPGGGFPYKNLTLATFLVDKFTMGMIVCKIQLISAGKNVPCIAGNTKDFESRFVNEKGTTFPSLAIGDIGPVCGVTRSDSQDEEDFNVRFRIFYTRSSTCPLTGVPLQIGTGIFYEDGDMGWGSSLPYSLTNTLFSDSNFKDLSKPSFFMISSTEPTVSLAINETTVVKAVIKYPQGSQRPFALNIFVSMTTDVFICNVFLVAVGSNYGCIDTDFESLSHKPDIFLTYNVTGKRKGALLDLGYLTNFGSGTMHNFTAADEDSIVVGVLVTRVGSAVENVNFHLTDLHFNPTMYVPIEENPLGFQPSLSGTLNGTIIGYNGNNDAYPNVIKAFRFILIVVPGFQDMLKFQITNTDLTKLSVCNLNFIKAGDNFPCMRTEFDPPIVEESPTSQKIELEIGGVRPFPISSDPKANEIELVISIKISKGVGSISISVDVIGLTTTQTFQFDIAERTDQYVPVYQPIPHINRNVSLDPITATPGTYTMLDQYIPFPPFIESQPSEIHVFTLSEEGRAYVTLQNVRVMSNLGCFLPTDYEVELTQTDLLHESQKDLAIVDLLYLTNLVSLAANISMTVEADLRIADHPLAVDASNISVYYVLTVGDAHFAHVRNITLNKTIEVQELQLNSSLILNNGIGTLFKQGDQISLTALISHLNTSTAEANNATVRFFLPFNCVLVNDSDTWSSNINDTTLKNKGYLDFNISFISFEDEVEINFTVTVDPDMKFRKGLGTLNTYAMLRVLCSLFEVGIPRQYCGQTQIVPIDIYVAAWSPAARSGLGWQHHVTVDFLRNSRLTRISFLNPGSSFRKVASFKLHTSKDGRNFEPFCEIEIPVPSNGVVDLPQECRGLMRLARIVIVSASKPEIRPIGVKLNMYGCSYDSSTSSCENRPSTTVYADQTNTFRHAAYDPVNNIMYFCDFSMVARRMICFYSADSGVTWIALPAYIGRLVGFDAASSRMLVKDYKERAIVASSDGQTWNLVDSSQYAALEASASGIAGIPGKVKKDLIPVDLGGGWEGNFEGLSLSGVYKVKWESCCS